MNEPMNFDSLVPAEVRVTIEGKTYTLREANGFAAREYRAACLGGMEMTQGEDGSRTTKRLQGIAKVEALLVSLCLYDQENKNVPVQTVESWPARVTKALFERAKEISDLDEKEDLTSLRRQRAFIDAKICRAELAEAGPEKN